MQNLHVEEGPEHNNHNSSFNREHHSQQNSLQTNLIDTFLHSTHASDLEILKIIEDSLPKKPNSPISPEVIRLLADSINDSDFDSDHSDGP